MTIVRPADGVVGRSSKIVRGREIKGGRCRTVRLAVATSWTGVWLRQLSSTRLISSNNRSWGGRTRQWQAQSRNRKARLYPNHPISPVSGSFSLDSGGWSLFPNLLLIFKVLMLGYMVDRHAYRIYASDYILLWFRQELSIEGVTWLSYWVD